MTDTDYIETVYAPKMRDLLEQVRAEALSRGLECDEPSDLTDEDVRWYVLVRPKGGPDESGVDVSLIACESKGYDGTEGGLNFSLDMVGYEGTIVGGFTPYNYTERCWVDREDPEAVAERWSLLANGFDASAVIDECERHFARE